jgi:hypothetical protein
MTQKHYINPRQLPQPHRRIRQPRPRHPRTKMNMTARMQKIRICHEPHALPFQNRGRRADEVDGRVGGGPGWGRGMLLGGFCWGQGGRGGVTVREGGAVAVRIGGREGADWGEGFGGVEDEVGERGHDGVFVRVGVGRCFRCLGDLVETQYVGLCESQVYKGWCRLCETQRSPSRTN